MRSRQAKGNQYMTCWYSIEINETLIFHRYFFNSHVKHKITGRWTVDIRLTLTKAWDFVDTVNSCDQGITTHKVTHRWTVDIKLRFMKGWYFVYTLISHMTRQAQGRRFFVNGFYSHVKVTSLSWYWTFNFNFRSYTSPTYPNFCLDGDGLTPAGGKIVGPGICPPVRGQLSLKDFFLNCGEMKYFVGYIGYGQWGLSAPLTIT